MKLAQGLQVLEILHPLFGMTRGGVLEPLMQVGAGEAGVGLGMEEMGRD